MDSAFIESVNIGLEEMVSINQLSETKMNIAGKRYPSSIIPGRLGIRGRNSVNKLFEEKLGWKSNFPLVEGLIKLITSSVIIVH